MKSADKTIEGVVVHAVDITDLKKSEKLYRFIADNSIDAIWQMDLKLKFTYISPSVYDIFGFTPEEWTGSALFQHATKKEFLRMAAEVASAVSSYRNFNYTRFEAEMLHKDGSVIPVEITGKLILNKKGIPTGIQGATRPIFERKTKSTDYQE